MEETKNKTKNPTKIGMRGAQIGLFGAAALNAFKGIASFLYLEQEPNSQAFIFI